MKRIEHPRLPGMGRGGKRKGAGRPPKGERSLTSHAKSPLVTRHDPLMITVKVRKDIPNLRNKKTLALFQSVLRAMRDFDGFRVVHYSLQRDHIHLIVEGDSTEAVSKGMQSLLIRFARAINRMLGRSGPVLADRYHAEEMKSPRETKNKLAYTLCNANKHGEAIGVGMELDRFSSAPVFPGWTELARAEVRDVTEQDVVSAPTSWRLTKGWRKHGLICPRFVPGRSKSKQRRRQPRKRLRER